MVSALVAEWLKWLRHRFTQGCLLTWIAIVLLLGTTGSELVMLTSIGQLFLLVWISIVVGKEFHWGTLQSFLVNGGITRIQLGIAKLSLAVVGSGLATLVLILTAVLVTAIGVCSGGLYWPAWHAYTPIGIFFSFLAYATLAFGLAVFGQSSNNALLLGILGYAMEWLVVGVLPVLQTLSALTSSDDGGFLTQIEKLFKLLSFRINANMGVGSLNINLVAGCPSEDWPRALIILMAYTGIIFGASFIHLIRRDLVAR